MSDPIVEALKDLFMPRITICAACVREGEGVRPGTFGDFSVCGRCHQSVTSKTLAFSVREDQITKRKGDQP